MNLVAPIRVVVVDDTPTHLFAIVTGLTLAGIPCVWHLYDGKEHCLVPEPPKGGYPHLRLLVTDLNIQEMVGANKNIKNLAGALISEVLKPLVSVDGGPYAVVLWTSVDAHAVEVEPLIKERINAVHLEMEDRRPAPLSITPLAKGRFLPTAGDDVMEGSLAQMFRDTAQKADEFKAAVGSAVASDPSLCLVSAWESRVGVSVASTMQSLHSIAVVEASENGSEPSNALASLLAKIAVDAVGPKNAGEEMTGALDAGLVDLVVDELGSRNRRQDYVEIVKRTLSNLIEEKPTLARATVCSLNTHLQLEESPSTRNVVTRGAVFEVGDAEVKNLCGQDVRQLLNSEFLPAANPSEDLLNGARIRLIEIGADCDHAQRKPRTIRLLVAAALPLSQLTPKQQASPRKLEGQHDALALLGPWKTQNEDFVLLVSLRRFVTVQEWACPDSLKMKFRLRKPVVDLLLHSYTTYSGRPGIVAISR